MRGRTSLVPQQDSFKGGYLAGCLVKAGRCLKGPSSFSARMASSMASRRSFLIISNVSFTVLLLKSFSSCALSSGSKYSSSSSEVVISMVLSTASCMLMMVWRTWPTTVIRESMSSCLAAKPCGVAAIREVSLPSYSSSSSSQSKRESDRRSNSLKDIPRSLLPFDHLFIYAMISRHLDDTSKRTESRGVFIDFSVL